MGRDVLGAEERVAHRAGRRRRPRARGASGERRGGARRDGAVRPGADRRQPSSRDDREVGRRHLRARQRAARRRVRRAPTPYPRRGLQRHANGAAARRARSNRGNSTRRQQYATAVYRSELATRLTALGYEIERGASGQPEIRGYTPAYLDASSPRRQQIQDHLDEGAADAAPAPRKSPRTRPAKPRSTARTRRCSAGIRSWRRPSAISRRAWCRPRRQRAHRVRARTSPQIDRRTRPSRSPRSGTSNARRSSTNAPCCAMR